MKLIVTAGGQGTKLWPYSREDKPKQFQPIIGQRSLFTYTIDTLLQRYSPEDIYISTKRRFIKYVSDQAPKIPLKNYIIEPDIAKDRGPAEGLAFVRMSVSYPDEPFMLIQADCIRSPEGSFLDMIAHAEEIVKRDKKYISGGIKATEPNMGVDYLQLGTALQNSFGEEVYAVEQFVDRKSSFQETKDLISGFHVVIHCNHSCWYPDLMLDAYKRFKPDWYSSLMQIRDVLDKPGEGEEIEKIYSQMEKGPTEIVTKNIFSEGYIILLKFKWTDIGTWNSVYEFFGKDEKVYADGLVVDVESTGSVVKSGDPHKLIALAGVENMVVVDTPDILLIVPKDKIEKIKDLQKLLKETGKTNYL